jgi:hypothetical protein
MWKRKSDVEILISKLRKGTRYSRIRKRLKRKIIDFWYRLLFLFSGKSKHFQWKSNTYDYLENMGKI